ncbi:hypothetical protein NAH03_23155, partial [Stenotrophomonas maltophilia]|uniref:hypothetical protein n=1 Tax=Stenotrophomonas maltophilia TaxID=40324 RepID=UPI0022587B52|nr:hypothetical protein [Stenotrophomonas maltophilia]
TLSEENGSGMGHKKNDSATQFSGSFFKQKTIYEIHFSFFFFLQGKGDIRSRPESCGRGDV